jgi:glutathione S-transferase
LPGRRAQAIASPPAQSALPAGCREDPLARAIQRPVSVEASTDRGEPMAPEVELVMFLSSHYNEKARWALDWKGIPHRRTSLLPGPHARVVQKLSGQTQVPVLRFDGEVIAGSNHILDALERRFPEPPLLPADPGERARALEIQTFFDDEVGPKIRRALFSVLLDEPAYLAKLFAHDRSAPARFLYRSVLPLVKGMMVRSMQIDDAHVPEAFEGTRRGFEFVAKEVGPSGYLVGEAFSLADLTAAALLAPGVRVEHPDMRKPEPCPARVEAWLARWADLPGAAWVRGIYERHRPERAPEA